jgi:hypothetical protein
VSSCSNSDSYNYTIDFDEPPMQVVMMPDEREKGKIATNKRLR